MTDPEHDPLKQRPEPPLPDASGAAAKPRTGESEDEPVDTIGADPATAPPPGTREPPADGQGPAVIVPAPPTSPSPVAEPAARGSPEVDAATPPPVAPPAPPPPVATAATPASSAPPPTAATGEMTPPPPAPDPGSPAGSPPVSPPVARGGDSGGPHHNHVVSSVVTQLTLPNLLTSLRCVLVLVVLVLLIWPWGPQMMGALVVFAIASITDWLDGRLARSFNLITPLGRMLDSIADKLLIGVTLLALCAIGTIDGVNVLAAALILAREIAISGLREHLGPRGVVVPASDLGKWKTTFQMVAIAALMAAPLAPFPMVARVAALLILWVAMVMTLVSGFQYAWGSRKVWSEE